jgi:hypothetical protein
MGQRLILRAQSRGSVLQKHETGIYAAVFGQKGRIGEGVAAAVHQFRNTPLRHVPQVCQRDIQEVQAKSQRFAAWKFPPEMTMGLPSSASPTSGLTVTAFS